ncbi:hypothetical protein [Streptomyces canus]|uniref:recombination directionality factor n=1 Tax=Streptomyces canus TaxID=58343 RepID=UPI003868084A|nr:hypothetical protein OH824_14015 [Streptomyces canus]
MPILTLQQRLRELGRIRIGQKVATAKGGTRPGKLDRFRLTSPSKELLDRVAAKYGGIVNPWTPDGGAGQYEVITDARRMPIHVPPQPVSQYFELWSGGGCQRRCDGVTELLKDKPCICGPDPEQRQCKPTTRLNVVLSEIEGVGVWRLESHGYYAALELPGVAELLAQTGGYVEAFLGLEQRTAKRDGQTRHWMVPTIDVAVTPAALMAGGATVGAAVASGPQRAAIEAPPATAAGPDRDYLAEAKKAATQAEALAVFQAAKNAGAPIDYQEELKAIGLTKPITAPERSSAPELSTPAPDDEGVYDVEFVDDPADVQAVWFQIIAAAGQFGLTTEQVESGFAQRNGGVHPSSATVAQMNAYLAAVKAGEVR